MNRSLKNFETTALNFPAQSALRGGQDLSDLLKKMIELLDPTNPDDTTDEPTN